MVWFEKLKLCPDRNYDAMIGMSAHIWILTQNRAVLDLQNLNFWETLKSDFLNCFFFLLKCSPLELVSCRRTHLGPLRTVQFSKKTVLVSEFRSAIPGILFNKYCLRSHQNSVCGDLKCYWVEFAHRMLIDPLRKSLKALCLYSLARGQVRDSLTPWDHDLIGSDLESPQRFRKFERSWPVFGPFLSWKINRWLLCAM